MYSNKIQKKTNIFDFKKRTHTLFSLCTRFIRIQRNGKKRVKINFERKSSRTV